MTDTSHDPYRGREVVKSDRRLEQEAAAEEAQGEVPTKAADVKAWLEDAPDDDERVRRAGLASDVEGNRSEQRVTVLDAIEAAYAPTEADDEG